MIRLTVPSLDEVEIAAVSEVLASGMLVQGSRVIAFERAVADYVGVRHAIAVSNCTAALHLALLALEIGRGDIVLTTAFSWPATANAVELCGARPAFVDICPDTFNLDPQHLEEVLERLASDPQTAGRVKAILPVHAFGQLANMRAILALASQYSVAVIEDAACALGAALHGRQAGTWGVMGCFSFHPRKAITTGEGGIITTDDCALARRLRALRNHGQDPDSPTPDFILAGLNYRLTDLQGAIGVVQMKKLDRIIACRRQLAACYDGLLSETPLFRPPTVADSEPVHQSYVVLLPSQVPMTRSELIQCLKGRGIETTIGTWHIPLTSYYRSRYGYLPGDFPVTDDVFARALTLPLHERLTGAAQAEVVDSLTSLLEQCYR